MYKAPFVKIQLYRNEMELTQLKGIGEKRINILTTANINCGFDLVTYFPKIYYMLGDEEAYNEKKQSQLIKIKTISEPVNQFIRKGFCITSIKAQDENNKKIIKLVWYNQPYTKKRLENGIVYYTYGKPNINKDNEFIVKMIKSENKFKETGSGFAVYKNIGNIGTTLLKSLISQVLEKEIIDSVITSDEEKEFNLLPLQIAYKEIHFPTDTKTLEMARKRIDIERIVMLLALKYDKDKNIKLKSNSFICQDSYATEFKEMLEFKPTDGQLTAMEDISKDLSSNKIMNRLIEGDTGCGKTIVAFYACYLAYKNKYQSVLMAPTEILASQHYIEALKLFKGKINIAYLHSGLKTAERNRILAGIKIGFYELVIGTHAVIGDKVEYKNLRLVITDEQHRFGVSSRAKLSYKGDAPETLVMSATPIPRSLALVLFGDLDISIIKDKPFGKSLTETHLVPENKINNMWNFITNFLNKNSSSMYIVCPRVVEDEEDDSLKNVQNTATLIKNMHIFDSFGIKVLHGGQKTEEKIATINAFKSGEVRVLVTTTIVEVGVDNPNANVMVILSPDTYGLASLHQLRGRVGRHGGQAYCFLDMENISISASDRLNFFSKTNDGFVVAEYDYNNRGYGDIYSLKQHGKTTQSFSFSKENIELSKKLLNKLKINNDILLSITNKAKECFKNIYENVVLN
ncbi:MAG: helicase-related protein [Clostridia bacterium]